MGADDWSDAEEALAGAQLVANLLEERLLRGGLAPGAHRVLMRAWERSARALEHHQQVVEGLTRGDEWGG